MANGNGVPSIPGFFVGGGVALSNTAIMIGGLAVVAWLWLTLNKTKPPAMDDESIAQQIEGDVFAYAASPQSVNENRDRIRAAINAIRDKFTEAREAYQKKMRDLITAKKAGTITQAQFQAQHRIALTEFRAAVKTRHREIMQELNIPHFASNIAEAMPTIG